MATSAKTAGGLSEAFIAFAAATREALRAGDKVSRTYAFADSRVRVTWASRAAGAAMHRALAHLEAPAGGAVDLEVVVWDSETTGIPLPREIGPLGDHVRQGLANVRREGSLSSLYEGHDHGLTMLSRDDGAGIYWMPDASRISEGDRAAPLRALLNWWLPERGLMVAHAAALQLEDAGVLLAGKSGAGKSTAALACVEAGFAYLGDDFCALSLQPPTVHSIYCSAKIHGHSLARAEAFRPHVTNAEALEDEKAVMYLTEIEPSLVVRRSELVAVIILGARGRPAPALRRVGAASALRALAATTALNLAGSTQAGLAGLAALVGEVPCFELDLADEGQENAAAIADLLARLPSPERASDTSIAGQAHDGRPDR